MGLIQNASMSSSPVKWLVYSRNRPDIEGRLRISDCTVKLGLELNAKSVSAAVAIYIDRKVAEPAKVKQYDITLQNQVRDQLHQKGNETFSLGRPHSQKAPRCQEVGRSSDDPARPARSLDRPRPTEARSRILKSYCERWSIFS